MRQIIGVQQEREQEARRSVKINKSPLCHGHTQSVQCCGGEGLLVKIRAQPDRNKQHGHDEWFGIEIESSPGLMIEGSTKVFFLYGAEP